MSKLIVFLTSVIVVLVGALMFMLGRNIERDGAEQAGRPIVTKLPREPASAVRASTRKDQTKVPKRPALAARPVRIGLDGPQFDACGSNGRVVGLNPNGDNFLAVKAGPSLSARRLDKLGPGQDVYVCETIGTWHSVVYDPSGGPTSRCGVTSPVETQRPYNGPCQSGWVSSRYIDIYAG